MSINNNSRRPPITRTVEENESGCFSFIKVHYHYIISSKIPTYFGLVIYCIICLFGNVVTGLMWLKHYQLRGVKLQENITGLYDNETLIQLPLNDTTRIDQFSYDLDEDRNEGEAWDVIEFLTNASKNEDSVSLYF